MGLISGVNTNYIVNSIGRVNISIGPSLMTLPYSVSPRTTLLNVGVLVFVEWYKHQNRNKMRKKSTGAKYNHQNKKII
jgi:hypothetical protein